MSKGKVRILSVVSGAQHLKPLLDDFVAGGPGLVTSISDARFRVLGRLLSGHLDTVRPFGDVVGESITRAAGRKLILAQAGYVTAAVEVACSNLPPESPFIEAAGFPGTHRRIAATLDELREWGMDSNDMFAVSERLNGDLAEKVRSLGLIDRQVTDILRSVARERNTDRIASALCLKPDRTEMGRLLVVVGSDLADKQADWLVWVRDQGTDLTIVFEQGASGSVEAIKPILARLGDVSPPKGTPNQLQAKLFGGLAHAPKKIQPLEVQIVSSADALAECEWALRAIDEEISAGASIEEICILCRDQDGYIPLLESSALRLGVPVSCSRRLPLLSNSFARLTLDVLDFSAGSDVRDLSKIIRTSYFHLESTIREKVDQEVKRAYKSGEQQWKALEQFAAASDDLPWLSLLLEWRVDSLQFITPLSDWCDRLLDLGHQPWHAEALSGTTRAGIRDSYAQSAMQRSLAQHASIERVQARKPIDLKQFARRCRWIWKNAEVSTPTDPDAIQVVGSAAAIGNVRSVYALGLLEGVFPRRRSEDPILTDKDRAALIQAFCGLSGLKNSHDKALAERDEFWRLCGAPSQRLVLSYPQTDDERDNIRAFYLVEVERAMDGNAIHEDHSRIELTESPAKNEADQRLALALEDERSGPISFELITPKARAAIAESSTRHLTLRDLGDLFECPFRYLVEGNLNLSPNRNRSRWSRLYRLPRSTGLAYLPFRESAQNALNGGLQALVDELIPESTPDDLALIKAGGARLMDEWLDREFAARELWPRDSITESPSFENGHLRSKLKAGDEFLFLQGEFPAVSERNGYSVLHLFFAADPLGDSTDGQKGLWDRLRPRQQLELGLILNALRTSGHHRVGIEIDHMSGGRLLFLSPRPDEHIHADQARNLKVCAIDRDQLAENNRALVENVRTLVKRIKNAMVEPTPEEQICLSCDFGELCRRSKEFGEEVDPFEDPAEHD
jgi:ATP-dependent helicase/nuclease subunit B